MWFSTKKEAIKRYTNNHLPRPRSRQTSRIPPYLQIPDQSTSHIALAYRRAICLVIVARFYSQLFDSAYHLIGLLFAYSFPRIDSQNLALSIPIIVSR